MTVDLVQQMQTTVVVLDAADRVASMNPAAEALFRVSSARAHGMPYSALIVDLDHNGDPIAQARDTGQIISMHGARFRTVSAHEFSGTYTLTPLADPVDHLLIELRALGPAQRITRDEHQAMAQDAARLLIRGLAHEIKNPLGGLRGAAQLLSRELPSADLAEFTDIIISEADRLRDLVDRMLGSNQPPQYEPINIHQVLERVVRLVNADDQNLTIVRDYDPSLPELEADRDQLIQAVLNIVNNARQALTGLPNPDACVQLRTRAERQVTIGAQRHRLAIRIDIIDNGPGITPTMMERMFFPMISGRANGSGLGLSIAHSVVTQHQGTIDCTSEAGNTCFTIHLPLSQDERETSLENNTPV